MKEPHVILFAKELYVHFLAENEKLWDSDGSVFNSSEQLWEYSADEALSAAQLFYHIAEQP